MKPFLSVLAHALPVQCCSSASQACLLYYDCKRRVCTDKADQQGQPVLVCQSGTPMMRVISKTMPCRMPRQRICCWRC